LVPLTEMTCWIWWQLFPQTLANKLASFATDKPLLVHNAVAAPEANPDDHGNPSRCSC